MPNSILENNARSNEAKDSLLGSFSKYKEYISEYLQNQFELTKNSLKSFIFKIFLIISTIFIISGIILLAVGFIAYGLVLLLQALGVVFPGLSYILVGSVLLVIFILVLWKQASGPSTKKIQEFQNKIEQNKESLKQDVEEKIESISDALNVSHWIQKYPWASTGGALVFGFVVASTGMISTKNFTQPLQGRFNAVLSSLILVGADFFKTILLEKISIPSMQELKV